VVEVHDILDAVHYSYHVVVVAAVVGVHPYGPHACLVHLDVVVAVVHPFDHHDHHSRVAVVVAVHRNRQVGVEEEVHDKVLVEVHDGNLVDHKVVVVHASVDLLDLQDTYQEVVVHQVEVVDKDVEVDKVLLDYHAIHYYDD
jgi:hypothetical protein